MDTRSIAIAALAVALAACASKKDKDKDDTQPSAQPTASAAPTVAPAPPPPAIEAHVKVELDNRPDGITGTPLGVAGATALLHTPTGWTLTKGDLDVATSPDKKTHLAAASLPTPDGAPAKLPAVLTALGLTDCQWSAPEQLVVGKTKLASTGADGVCKHGATLIRTAWVNPTAEKLLVVGAWEPDGDLANVFGAMRSIAKPPAGDPTGLAACCAALRQNARSAPPEQRGYMLMAAAACDSMRTNPQGRAMIAQVRAQMRGQPLPAQCR